MRNSKKIQLFGREMVLAERNAVDVLDLADAKKENNYDMLFTLSKTLHDSLKILSYPEKPRWHQFFKMRRYRKEKRAIDSLISVKNLAGKLSDSELMHYADLIYELENSEIKKKWRERLLAGESQNG